MSSSYIKKFLTDNHTQTLIILALTIELYNTMNPSFGAEPTGLVAGETALVRGIFNDAVNTGTIRKHLDPIYDIDGYGAHTYNKRDIVFHGEKHHESDYSNPKNNILKSLFNHEITHIWQEQTNMQFTNGYCKKGKMQYNHTILPSSNFEGFCHEKQAMIIQNYTLRFLIDPAIKSYNYKKSLSNDFDDYNKDTPASDLALQKLVEGYFPQARITRLAFEAKNNINVANKNNAAALTM